MPFLQRVYRETRCTDENGRELMAMEVFAHSIRYLKNHLLQNLSLDLSEPHELKISDIDFVLTVPAIWDDTAKMFMREAAIMVRCKLMVYMYLSKFLTPQAIVCITLVLI